MAFTRSLRIQQVLALDVDGPLAGTLNVDGYDTERVVMADRSVRTYLNDRAASIYAGANEVQRNILATQILREAII